MVRSPHPRQGDSSIRVKTKPLSTTATTRPVPGLGCSLDINLIVRPNVPFGLPSFRNCITLRLGIPIAQDGPLKAISYG